jgi:RimJ/RimL family protein N-acetyltransferase
MPDFNYGRLNFQALDKNRLPIYMEWMRDPEVTHNLGVSMVPFSLIDEETWLEGEFKRPMDERTMNISIHDDNTSELKLIGNGGFHAIDRKEQSAEIWHGFHNLNLHRIWLRVHEPNKGGIRAYEKAGMKHEGTLREAHYQEGRFVDVHIMSILRHEWDQAQNKEG